jgi:hypothetical protein
VLKCQGSAWPPEDLRQPVAKSKPSIMCLQETVPVGQVVGDHAAAEADALQAVKFTIHHDAMQVFLL